MTKRVIRYGSLFSGCGGFDIGIEAAFTGRLQQVWNCERDEYPRRVLKKNFPYTTQHKDICEIGEKNVEAVDMLIGSPPCQDISFAGKRAGLAGDRSSLWFEYIRLVRELRPRLLVLENVAGACSPIREGKARRLVEQAMLGRVLGDLAESGYDAWWYCIRVGPPRNRRDRGAHADGPHERNRLFVVAYATGERERESTNEADSITARGEARTVAGGGSESELDNTYSERWDQTASRKVRAGRDTVVGAGSPELANAMRGGRDRIEADPERRISYGSDAGREQAHDIAQRGEGAEERSTASGSGRRSRSAVAELDRDVGRLASRLDGTDADRRREEDLERHFARGAWPARPGEAQREGEPPRTEFGIDFRAQRLKAIGNVVSPPVALAVGLVARAIWEHEFDE